ncbi:hypothetical protein [Sphingosinicella terrae]|uniref:hypothetical protein n=1 Tax=Sphingosinicella terrae TaxID=2172047 RepID=UPI000E0CD457|nr:hypothetical protein [Sphingosinicella terrae]
MSDRGSQVQRAHLIDFRGPGRRAARAHNFFVELFDPRKADAQAVESGHEMMLLLLDCEAQVDSDDVSTFVPSRSVALLPAGRHALRFNGDCPAVLLASDRPDLSDEAIVNGHLFVERDSRVLPVAEVDARKDGHSVQVIGIDSFAAPADNPRLKMLRSATMSINWCEYEGPRDRTQLSPHSHAEFEQGSLAMRGTFHHHFRVPWGRNANLWRADERIEALSPSLAVIPIDLIHTTEGVGDEMHLLIDIFSPPRGDFIARGWVQNSSDYE